MPALSFFYPDAHTTPYGVKTNCYAHMLGLQPGSGGLMNGEKKSQPGGRCKAKSAHTPFRLDDSDVAITQIRRRVKCDNPKSVTMIHVPTHSECSQRPFHAATT
jgi:hypothetical protein